MCQLRWWYDALFSHLFWHVLDRRVALIFWLFIILFSSYIRAGRTFIRGILTSFYGFFQGQHGTSQLTATTAGLFSVFSSMCLWPVLSVLYFPPQPEPCLFSHKMALFMTVSCVPSLAQSPALYQLYPHYAPHGRPTL